MGLGGPRGSLLPAKDCFIPLSTQVAAGCLDDYRVGPKFCSGFSIWHLWKNLNEIFGHPNNQRITDKLPVTVALIL